MRSAHIGEHRAVELKLVYRKPLAAIRASHRNHAAERAEMPVSLVTIKGIETPGAAMDMEAVDMEA
jgi:hypothetical protein